ncbi:MAG: stress response translation initiation inhibitor YciH [Candidatus Hadarchaeales archaeon]
MQGICPRCGLPAELCVCKEISREQQRITVYSESRRFGKVVTVIEGLDDKKSNLKELLKKLKSRMACGGTMRENAIELQGDHKNKIKEVLVELGFLPESIDIIE